MGRILLQSPQLDLTNPWVLIVLALVILYVLWRPFRRKDPLSKGMNSPSLQRSVEREMSSLLVELSDMARQITAQLDTRSAKLELLIKEADEKIAALRSASAGGSSNGPEPVSHMRILRDSAVPEGESLAVAPEVDPRHAEIYRLADAGDSHNEIARKLGRPSGEIELILALRPRA